MSDRKGWERLQQNAPCPEPDIHIGQESTEVCVSSRDAFPRNVRCHISGHSTHNAALCSHYACQVAKNCMVHNTARHRLQMMPVHFADALCNEDVLIGNQ